MNNANPLWGAPRIHGELLKLGIKVSEATVAKYMVRQVGKPSPTWRTFLRNEAIGIAAIDSVPVGDTSSLSAARPRRLVWLGLQQAGCGDGNH